MCRLQKLYPQHVLYVLLLLSTIQPFIDFSCIISILGQIHSILSAQLCAWVHAVTTDQTTPHLALFF